MAPINFKYALEDNSFLIKLLSTMLHTYMSYKLDTVINMSVLPYTSILTQVEHCVKMTCNQSDC